MNDLGESAVGYLKRAYGAIISDAVESIATAADALMGFIVAVLVLPLVPLALVYFLLIRGHSNCLLFSIGQKLKHWRAVEIVFGRNARGLPHWKVRVRETGAVYEYYAKGASTRPYWKNLWYVGHMRLVEGAKK